MYFTCDVRFAVENQSEVTISTVCGFREVCLCHLSVAGTAVRPEPHILEVFVQRALAQPLECA